MRNAILEYAADVGGALWVLSGKYPKLAGAILLG